MSQRSSYMTQMRHPVSTCAAQWKMWLFKVFGLIYMVAVCASDDNDATTYSYQKSESPAPSPFEPPVPDLQRTSPWSDVFPSEKVVLKCRATSSSELNFTWKKDGKTLDYSPNLSQPPDKSELTITVTSQDSGSYTCLVEGKNKPSQIKESKAVRIDVYAHKPKPTLTRDSNFDKMFPGESITFTCSVDVSSGWEYRWYHGQNEISGANAKTYTIRSVTTQNSGQYYCKGKRNEFLTDPSETTLYIIDPPTPVLQLKTGLKDVFENETVEFHCQVLNSISGWTFMWYRNNQLVQNNPVETTNGDGSLLKITSIRQTHQGSYTCKAHLKSRGVNSGFSNDVTIQVKVPPTPVLQLQTGLLDVFENETVEFHCQVLNSISGWTFTWYRNNQLVQNNPAETTIGDGSLLKITSVRQTHKGSYTCKAHLKSRGVESGFSNDVTIQVKEIPVPTIKERPQWPQVFPTENVKFKCGMEPDSYNWIYTWYRDGKVVHADDTVSFDPNGAGVSISSASAGHTGKYKCNGKIQDRAVTSQTSSEVILTVYDKKPTLTLTRDPDYDVMFAGEKVTFSCAISVQSEWKYLWYKDGSEVTGSTDKLGVQISGTANGGSYTCKATRGQNQAFITDLSAAEQLKVQENKPKPSMTQQPDAQKLYVGESVSFECKVEISVGWSYDWYKDGASSLTNSSSLKMEQIDLSEGGDYKCKAKRNKTGFNTEYSDNRTVEVSVPPTPVLQLQTAWKDVFENETVAFHCQVVNSISGWTFTWYRNNQPVQNNPAETTIGDGSLLKITSVRQTHKGSYTCKAHLKSRGVDSGFSNDVTIQVKVPPTPVLQLQTAWKDVFENEAVEFNCQVRNSISGWSFTWYRNNQPVQNNPVETTIGDGSLLKITSVQQTHQGSYTCKAHLKSRGVKSGFSKEKVTIQVKERPKATIALLTGWSEVFSTDSLILKCEVKESTHNWTNYAWFKEGGKINSSSTDKHEVTPHNDPDQSTYTCHALAAERPLYSKDSDSFKTKNLLLKRRVLLSISGCIVFGIAAILIGCVLLNVFRKRDGRVDKPEEVNLFPTMAELKITDVPCPLVEYITDASLNAPAKEEEEENGTVCSETTPLPITKQEDEAATTDNQEKTETNGGLSSFQKK